MVHSKRKPFQKPGEPSGSNKKFKGPDEDKDEFEPDFEAQLAALEAEEAGVDGVVTSVGQGPEGENTCDKWSRPKPREYRPDEDRLVFQQIDIDHYVGRPLPGMPGAQIESVPVFRMFGITEEGNSVCANVHGFAPYLYVAAPRGFDKSHLCEFRKALDKSVLNNMRSNKENVQEAVLDVELVERQSIMGYHGEDKFTFIKVTVTLPRLSAAVNRLLEKEQMMPPMDFQDCTVYESNIDFDIQMTNDEICLESALEDHFHHSNKYMKYIPS